MGSFSSYMDNERKKIEERNVFDPKPATPKGSFSQYMSRQTAISRPTVPIQAKIQEDPWYRKTGQAIGSGLRKFTAASDAFIRPFTKAYTLGLSPLAEKAGSFVADKTKQLFGETPKEREARHKRIAQQEEAIRKSISPTTQKVAGVAGTVIGFAQPTQLAYKTLGRAGVAGLSKLAPNAGKLATEAVRGASAGLGVGALEGVLAGDNLKGIAKSAAIGAAGGAILDPAFMKAGQLVGGLASRIRSRLSKGRIEPIETPKTQARPIELPPADIPLLPPGRVTPDFTADAFGNVSRGTGPAGLLPPANIAQPRRFKLPDAQTELQQAIDNYNAAVEAIQNYLGHYDVLAKSPPGTTIEEALSQAEKATGVSLRDAIARVELAEQKATQTLRGELQSKKVGLGPSIKNYLGPNLKKPGSIPTKEVGQVDWRIGKPELPKKPFNNLEPPLQFKKQIIVPKPLQSPLSPQKRTLNIGTNKEVLTEQGTLKQLKAERDQLLADTAPPISRLDQVTAKHRQEVSRGLQEAATPSIGQSIKMVGGPFDGGYQPVVPEVEQALKAGQKPLSGIWANIGRRISKFIEDSHNEPTLREFPRVKEHIRYSKEIPSIARMEATEAVEGVLGDVSREEMDIFTRKVVYEDWLESLAKGEKIPFDLQEVSVRQELANVEKYMTPKLKRAYERHLEVVNAIAEDLISRGKLSREAVRGNYFPHKVLFEYSQLLDERIPGLPEKLKTPFRGYVQRRKGSVKPIATDYIDTMHNLITKVKIDNAIDDTIENLAKIGEDYTKQSGMPTELIDKIRRTGIPESYNGKLYKAWQPDTGNYFYPSLSITEEAVQKAIAENVPLEVQAILGESLGEGFVIGRKKPTYVLPAEVADRLNNYRKHNIETEIAKALQGYTQWWKRVAVLMPGLKHDWFNIIGDLDRFTTGLGTKDLPKMLAKAAKMIKDKDPQLKEFLRRGVFSSEVYIYNTGKFSSPKLRELSGPLGKVSYYNPLSVYQRWRVYREAVPRIAAHLLNEERRQAGKPLINRFAVDVEGLLPKEAVAKIGRETMIDYNMLSKNTEHAKKFWLPFVTWYTQNFKSYASMVAKKPVYGLARIFLPMAALTVWNRVMYPDVEKNLPDYWRENPHLITGIQNKEGGYYIIPVPFAGAIAASMVGLHTLPDKVARYLSGEISLADMLKEQGKDILTGPFGAARDLLTPFVKGPAELLANKDFRTGFTIVPRELKGTPEALKLQGKHLLKSFVPPVSKGMQWMDEAEREGPKVPLAAQPFGTKLFDPEKQKRKDMENLIYEYSSEEMRNQVRQDFIRAFKEWEANPTKANWQTLYTVSQRLSKEQVQNIIDEIKNPLTREQKVQGAYERVPKALRPELNKKLIEIQNR